MADSVTAQLLENGPRRWAYMFTNLSDGTGESAVTKVDGSSGGPLGVTIAGNTLYPGVHLKISHIDYDINGMTVEFLWDATSAQQCVILGGMGGSMSWRKMGGLFIPTTLVGATGKLLLTTIQPAVNASYSIRIYGTKGIQQ